MYSVLHCPLIVIVNRLHGLLPYMLVNVLSETLSWTRDHLCLIGERCCQGYSAVLAEGAINDDCINLGHIQ